MPKIRAKVPADIPGIIIDAPTREDLIKRDRENFFLSGRFKRELLLTKMV